MFNRHFICLAGIATLLSLPGCEAADQSSAILTPGSNDRAFSAEDKRAAAVLSIGGGALASVGSQSGADQAGECARAITTVMERLQNVNSLSREQASSLAVVERYYRQRAVEVSASPTDTVTAAEVDDDDERDAALSVACIRNYVQTVGGGGT